MRPIAANGCCFVAPPQKRSILITVLDRPLRRGPVHGPLGDIAGSWIPRFRHTLENLFGCEAHRVLLVIGRPCRNKGHVLDGYPVANSLWKVRSYKHSQPFTSTTESFGKCHCWHCPNSSKSHRGSFAEYAGIGLTLTDRPIELQMIISHAAMPATVERSTVASTTPCSISIVAFPISSP